LAAEITAKQAANAGEQALKAVVAGIEAAEIIDKPIITAAPIATKPIATKYVADTQKRASARASVPKKVASIERRPKTKEETPQLKKAPETPRVAKTNTLNETVKLPVKQEVKPAVEPKRQKAKLEIAATLSPEPKKIVKVPDVGPQKVHIVDALWTHAQKVTQLYPRSPEELMMDEAEVANGDVPGLLSEAVYPVVEDQGAEIDTRHDEIEVEGFDIGDLVAMAQQETGIVSTQNQEEPQGNRFAEFFNDETPEPVEKWLPQQLEVLEPEQIAAVEPVFAEVIDLVGQLQVLKEAPGEPDEAQIQVVEQALEELTVELLGQLDLEPDDAKVRQFIKLMTDPEFIAKLPKELSTRQLNEMGTYEYKPSGLAQIFNDLLQDIKQKFHWVGRYPVMLAT
jgi:hypothetical protein